MARISTLQEHSAMLASLQNAVAGSQAQSNRVASGRAFNQPADDPLAAVRLMTVNRRIAAMDIYLEKIDDLNSSLAQEDIMLRGVYPAGWGG